MASITEIQRMDNCRPGITPETSPVSRALEGSILADEIARLAHQWEQAYAGRPEETRTRFCELTPEDRARRREDAEAYLIRRIGPCDVRARALTWLSVRRSNELHLEVSAEIERLIHGCVEDALRRIDKEAHAVWRLEQARFEREGMTRLDRAIARDPMMPEGDAR